MASQMTRALVIGLTPATFSRKRKKIAESGKKLPKAEKGSRKIGNTGSHKIYLVIVL